ncbi:hypothetical protein SAMN05192569_11032, partial [Parageobacillus thermantarcticus]
GVFGPLFILPKGKQHGSFSISLFTQLYGLNFVAAGRKQEVLTDECLSETFQLAIKVHWENNRPWASIHKNIGGTKLRRQDQHK